MAFLKVANLFHWTWLVSMHFCLARCDFVCSRCGGEVTTNPISVNIFEQTNGFYLWVNPQGKLSNGAVDIDEGSSIFEIHLYYPDDPNSFWIQTKLASEPARIVATNFSADPSLVVVNEGTSGVIEQFQFEGGDKIARCVSVSDPVTGTKLYWSIDPSDSTAVILSPQQAPIFVIQEKNN